ncbi:MAG: hypothetical protein KGJ38_08315 [Burkholderiaceae bacterium]|nr:hypothetical protein [Burkholderiaceae bacterium]
MAIVKIPFSGLYYSMHDAELDRSCEHLFADESGDPYEGLCSRASDTMNWGAVHQAYARRYAQRFLEEFDIKGEFESMRSPREYNFETDRIFVDIPDKEFARLQAKVPVDTLREVAAEWFTSRSGFMSFYSPDPDEWGELDHNTRGCILEAYVRHVEPDFDEFDLMEWDRCNGFIDELLFSNCKDGARLDRVCQYLRNRESR